MSPQKPAATVYSGFNYNFQNLETTKMTSNNPTIETIWQRHLNFWISLSFWTGKKGRRNENSGLSLQYTSRIIGNIIKKFLSSN